VAEIDRIFEAALELKARGPLAFLSHAMVDQGSVR